VKTDTKHWAQAGQARIRTRKRESSISTAASASEPRTAQAASESFGQHSSQPNPCAVLSTFFTAACFRGLGRKIVTAPRIVDPPP
jgi:hypothetical protein